MPRPITWRRHADAQNRWEVAQAPAAAALAGAVRGYSHYDEQVGGFAARREMPNTQAVLIINFGETVHLTGGDGHGIAVRAGQGFIAGAHTRPAVSRAETGGQRGVHIHMPLATLRRLFRIDMPDLLDRVVPLDDVFGRGVKGFGEELADLPAASCFDRLDAHLERRLDDDRGRDRVLAWAIGRLHRNPATRVEALATEIGWSRKHFATKFRAETGVTPRLYARVRRFERLLGNLTHGTRPHWADLAAAHGFADQPHLARELRDLSGLTPTDLMARLLPDGGFVEA